MTLKLECRTPSQVAPVYGRQKTTVYIPEELKRSLARAAAARGWSEAELIREALRAVTAHSTPPRPRLPLFKSGKPRLAERVEEARRLRRIVVLPDGLQAAAARPLRGWP
jgi:Ribbon-helix-helix protein, copG family